MENNLVIISVFSNHSTVGKIIKLIDILALALARFPCVISCWASLDMKSCKTFINVDCMTTKQADLCTQLGLVRKYVSIFPSVYITAPEAGRPKGHFDSFGQESDWITGTEFGQTKVSFQSGMWRTFMLAWWETLGQDNIRLPSRH